MGKSYSTSSAFDDDFYAPNFKGGKVMPRCFESHPPLPIGEYKIYGGSCSVPIHNDADVYIGFDWSMKLTPPPYPWETPKPLNHTEVLFRITDGGVPQDVPNFKKLIAWTIEQLKAGKKVHTGCIGGHGRTGMFLAALVKEMTGEKDAITYVRNNYCQKAVETSAQVKFLEKEFGISPVSGYKEGKKYDSGWTKPKTHGSKGTTATAPYTPPPPSYSSKSTIQPVASPRNIWKKSLDKPA